MDPEVARIIGEIRDELRALRAELVRKDVCDEKHRNDAGRLDDIEQELRDARNARRNLWTGIVATAVGVLLSLIVGIGGALVGTLGH